MKVTFDDHSDEVLAAMESAVAVAVETCGLAAEDYAKRLCPVDTQQPAQQHYKYGEHI